MKKTLLSIAIIAALPMVANAAYTYNTVNTPAQVANNGTVTMAPSGPYQTITPGEHDDEHIASTKYVIGAYNDAIAAVNKVNSEKQDKFNGVYDKNNGQNMVMDYFGAFNIGESENFFDDLTDNTVLTADGTIAAIGEAVNLQRVLVYTTWEDDTAKTGVPLANELGFQQQIY